MRRGGRGAGCTLSLEGHSGIVLGMDVLEQPPVSASGAPHGTLLLTGSKDNTMRLWQLPGGRCLGAAPPACPPLPLHLAQVPQPPHVYHSSPAQGLIA